MRNVDVAGQSVAVLEPTERIQTARDALDYMATAQYEYGSDALILYSACLPAAFFDLKTGLAGEILQKFSNYGMCLAIIGDFSAAKSMALQAFIRECNRGRQVFWVNSLDAALGALARQPKKTRG